MDHGVVIDSPLTPFDIPLGEDYTIDSQGMVPAMELVMNAIPASDRTVTPAHNKPVDATKLTDAQKDAIAQAQDKLVEKLGAVIDDEVNDIVVKIDEDRKNAAAGPFILLKWFKMHVDADVLETFPTPGSEVGDNPDKYSEPYFRDGKKKYKATSFYLKFFLQSFPAGKNIAAALAHISLAKDENANQAAVPESIRRMNPVQLEAYRVDLMKQQNSGVKALRDCIALSKQLDAVNNLPECRAEPIMDGDDVARIAKPIKVWNTKKPDSEWNLYSISGFMQFDPATAEEQGGTYDALKLTAKRERANDEAHGNGGTADKPVAINTNATMVARINDMAEYVANKLMPEGSRNREVYGLFLKDHINGADSGDLIYNLNELKLFIDGVLNIPAVQIKLEEVQKIRNAA